MTLTENVLNFPIISGCRDRSKKHRKMTQSRGRGGLSVRSPRVRGTRHISTRKSSHCPYQCRDYPCEITAEQECDECGARDMRRTWRSFAPPGARSCLVPAHEGAARKTSRSDPRREDSKALCAVAIEPGEPCYDYTYM